MSTEARSPRRLGSRGARPRGIPGRHPVAPWAAPHPGPPGRARLPPGHSPTGSPGSSDPLLEGWREATGAAPPGLPAGAMGWGPGSRIGAKSGPAFCRPPGPGPKRLRERLAGASPPSASSASGGAPLEGASPPHRPAVSSALAVGSRDGVLRPRSRPGAAAFGRTSGSARGGRRRAPDIFSISSVPEASSLGARRGLLGLGGLVFGLGGSSAVLGEPGCWTPGGLAALGSGAASGAASTPRGCTVRDFGVSDAAARESESGSGTSPPPPQPAQIRHAPGHRQAAEPRSKRSHRGDPSLSNGSGRGSAQDPPRRRSAGSTPARSITDTASRSL